MRQHSSMETGRPPAVGRLRFIVGPDCAGHWLAVETHGLGSGLFRSQEAALRYARSETDRRPGAVRLTSRPLKLAF